MPETPESSFSFEKYAVYANSSRSADIWTRSTGLQTHALHYDNTTWADTARTAETFLVNTRLVRGDVASSLSIQAYFTDVATTMLSLAGREAVRREVVRLPESAAMAMDFQCVIAGRRTVRSFTGDPATVPYLAAILRSVAGRSGSGHVALADGETATLHFRATPSGGGLFPIELYAMALNVRGLSNGVYRYRSATDDLVREYGPETVEALRPTFAMPDDMLSVSRASIVLLFVARPWRSMRKYGERGMRFVFHEVGAMAEHANLACVALGLGSADCASVYDDEVHEILGFDGLYTSLIHTVVIGAPA